MRDALARRSADGASPPAAFYVLRSSGHVGSRWLAELLTTQNLTFFFEFPARCAVKRYPEMENVSIAEIFSRACDCQLDAAMEQVCASDADGRIHSMSCVKDAFCSSRCPPHSITRGHCTGVGMIDSYQPALARRLAGARDGAPPSFRLGVVTFERDNAAKHAMSKLRASCGGSSLKGNHLKRGNSSEGMAAPPAPPSAKALVYVDPPLFFAEAYQSLYGRRRMRRGVRDALGVPLHELHYEDLQGDPAGALRAMLKSVGVRRFSQDALSRSGLRKGSPDDLRTSLLNFRELQDSLSGVPCLQRMLEARGPRRFDDACAVQEAEEQLIRGTEGGGGGVKPIPHQAKQDVSARVLDCRWEQPTQGERSPVCEVRSMNRIAAAAVAHTAKRNGLKAKRAKRVAGAEGAWELANASHLPHEAAQLIGGQCTRSERALCVRALHRLGEGRSQASSSSGSSVVPTEAELCVLRSADQPFGDDGHHGRRLLDSGAPSGKKSVISLLATLSDGLASYSMPKPGACRASKQDGPLRRAVPLSDAARAALAARSTARGEAVLVEHRRLRRLPALLDHFHSLLPPSWQITWLHGPHNADLVADSPSLSDYAAQASLRLLPIPKHILSEIRRGEELAAGASRAVRSGAGRTAASTKELWIQRQRAQNAVHDAKRRWYNVWLKQPEFWRQFSAPSILLFEADSVLCPRPSLPLEWWVGRYAYVGAPWHPGVGVGKQWCPTLRHGCCVGNSGLSLWDRRTIVRVLESKRNASKDVGMVDIWASRELQQLERRTEQGLSMPAVPSEPFASAFSCSDPPEALWHSVPDVVPFGVHGVRFWPETRFRHAGAGPMVLPCPDSLSISNQLRCRRLLQQCPAISAISINKSLDGEYPLPSPIQTMARRRPANANISLKLKLTRS